MIKIYSPLETSSLKTNTTYFSPVEPSAVLHWDDSALMGMIDFKYLKPPTITPDDVIDTALLGVKNSTYHVLLVVNKEQHILGIITAEDLLGEKPLKAIQDRRIARSDLAVSMVMTPRHELLTINVENMRHAKIGHIVETLRAHKQHYLLIVEIDEIMQTQTVRGLFSSALLSSQLDQDVLSALPEAHSIAELQHGLPLDD